MCPVVLVHWIDIVRESNPWCSWKDAIETGPMECHSVGWLLLVNDDVVVIATTVGNTKDDDVGGAVTIPRCVVTEMTYLEG